MFEYIECKTIRVGSKFVCVSKNIKCPLRFYFYFKIPFPGDGQSYTGDAHHKPASSVSTSGSACRNAAIPACWATLDAQINRFCCNFCKDRIQDLGAIKMTQPKPRHRKAFRESVQDKSLIGIFKDAVRTPFIHKAVINFI